MSTRSGPGEITPRPQDRDARRKRGDMKVTRRKSLAAIAAALGALGGCAATQAQKRPAVVLVHGAWHGPWCWDKLAAALRNAGHEVSVVDLQGTPTGRAP